MNKSLEKGILLTKDVVRFFKKRLEIEEVYCKSLQKAAQKFEPTVSTGYETTTTNTSTIHLSPLSHIVQYLLYFQHL